MPFTSAELTSTYEYSINGVKQPDLEVPIDQYSSWTIGPNWGMQRQVGKSFSLEFIAGPCVEYLSDDEKWRPSVNIDFRFSYVIK